MYNIPQRKGGLFNKVRSLFRLKRPKEEDDRLGRISNPALAEVLEAVEDYELKLALSDLNPRTREIYLLHARNFVRWLADDFNPGIESLFK